MKQNDGGYYAIKGFVYQIDKTILDILKNPQSEVNFEQNQDIDFDDFVIQVKYKERAKYCPSQIKEPVVQLLDLFKNDNTKKYHLYAYFKDKPEECKTITLEELDIILGNNKFDGDLKKSFISNFTLNFSQNFDEHFKDVIEKIKTEFSYTSDEEALFAHGIIVDHLFRKVTSNKEGYIQERKSSKSELQSVLLTHKSCIFYSAYRDFLGEEKYLKFVKSKFIKPKKQGSENFIYLENIKIDPSVDLTKLIIDITEKYFDKAVYTIKPIVFVVPDSKVLNIKTDLIGKGIVFNDGFESIRFNSELFLREALLTRKMVAKRAGDSLERIEFKVRIISQATLFQQMIEEAYSPDMVYCFGTENLKVFDSKSYIKIDGLNSYQILQLFNS